MVSFASRCQKGLLSALLFFVVCSFFASTVMLATPGSAFAQDEAKKDGAPAHHVEGLERGRWVLLDFVDLVVHVFHPALREFYQLERLWGDAAVVDVDQQGATK